MPQRLTWFTAQHELPQFGPPCRNLKPLPKGPRRKKKKNGGSDTLWRFQRDRQTSLYRPVTKYFLSDKPLDYDQFLVSPYWLQLRKEVLARRTTCEDCGFATRLQLHHLCYYRNGRSVLYHEREHPGIFVVLCRDCHMKRHLKE